VIQTSHPSEDRLADINKSKSMADNIDEEHSDNPINNQSENSPDEINPTQDIPTTPNQETKNMEVHHHPDLHHRKKHWKEYVLEFIMIFLAVTLGFFAENLRVHIEDRAKEKDYMVSLVEDLKYDTARYNKALYEVKELRPLLDSAYENIKEANRYNYVLQGKWNGYINNINADYKPVLPTIQQLQSSGNLRLIENKLVLNKMMEYEAFVKVNIEEINNSINFASRKIYALEDALCDYTRFAILAPQVNITNLNDKDVYSDYDMPLFVKDTVRLNEFANSFVNFRATNETYSITVNGAKKSAAELIALLQKEYHLENE
jgi:hypothetical protein